MRIHILLLVGLLFWACPDPVSNSDPDYPLSNSQFNFHQDSEKIYFGIYVDDTYLGESLSSVRVNWYGASKENNIDTLLLNDEGAHGDILINDGLFALKIPNDSLVISNVLGDDSGYVYVDYVANYSTEIISQTDSFRIGNIIPRINYVSAPDTIIRPEGATVSLHLIMAEAFDADGLETIKWLGFTSFHVDGDSMMNSGNYIYLYDDGSEDILYEPDFTSGDSVKSDGIYSFRIPVYGTGFTDPAFQTKTGSFIWRFICQDDDESYSKIVEHTVVIE